LKAYLGELKAYLWATDHTSSNIISREKWTWSKVGGRKVDFLLIQNIYWNLKFVIAEIVNNSFG
jgi:hypothetical protein